MLTDLSATMRSPTVRAAGWVDFAERLAALISELPTRRRQALVMLLFALSQHLLTSDQADAWIAGHDVDRDQGVEDLIAWLRQVPPSAG
jgi:hypothetical protein